MRTTGIPRADLAVFIYLGVVAVLNIGFGYALAVYLNRGAQVAVAETVADPSTLPTRQHAAPEPVAPPIAAAPVAPSAAPVASAAPVGESAAAPQGADVEQQLLAGIEEFRSQLAQMKTEPADAATPAEAAAAATA